LKSLQNQGALWTIFFLCSLSSRVRATPPSSTKAQDTKRIVSLNLAADETLFQILNRCDHNLKRLVAVSKLSEDPQFSHIASDVKAIRHRVDTNIENIVRLKPDLVIAAEFNRPAVITGLKNRGINTLVLENFSTVQNIKDHVVLLGTALGCQAEAQKIVGEMDQTIESIKSTHKLKPHQTFLVYSDSNRVLAGDTIFDEISHWFNLQNLATKSGLKHWPLVSRETLTKWNPDLILIPCINPKLTKDCSKGLINNSAWGHMDAVKNRKFLFVSEGDLSSASPFLVHTELTSIP
jgi:iron complex transport system substrate-binding protein